MEKILSKRLSDKSLIVLLSLSFLFKSIFLFLNTLRLFSLTVSLNDCPSKILFSIISN